MDASVGAFLSKILPNSAPAVVWCVVAFVVGGGQAFSYWVDYEKLEERVAEVEEEFQTLPPALARIQTDLEWIKKELAQMPRMKEGVSFSEITPQAIQVFEAVDRVWVHLTGEQATITSAEDGKHSEESLHYQSAAWDVRIWPFLSGDGVQDGRKSTKTKDAAALLRVFLGPDFDVVVEKTHIHVEHDPKTPSV